LARSADIARLEVRGRIRHLELAIDPVLVKRAGRQARDRGLVPAARQCLHRMRAVEQELDLPCCRGPQAEVDAVGAECGTKPQVAAHAVPAKASTERGSACIVVPEANCLPRRGLVVVSSNTVHCPCSASVGKANAIASGAALSTI